MSTATTSPNKKAPAASSTEPPKPKRPLTSYNLFYRFKRTKILAAIARGDATPDSIRALLEAPPGTEDHPPSSLDLASPEAVIELRRKNIRDEMKDGLAPKDTVKRSHRTNSNAMNGMMSFVELGKVMNAAWKACDEPTKAVFRDLAEEGRKIYHIRMEGYEAEVKVRKEREIIEKKRRAEQAKLAERERKAIERESKRLARQAEKATKEAAKRKKSAKKASLAAKRTLKANPARKSLPTHNQLKRLTSNEGSPVSDDDNSHRAMTDLIRRAAQAAAPANRLAPTVHRNSAIIPPTPTPPEGLGHSQHGLPQGQVQIQAPPLAQAAQAQLVAHAQAAQAAQQAQSQALSRGGSSESLLRARVADLEQRLVEERLKARVRELEISLAKKKSIELQMRAQQELEVRQLERLRVEMGLQNCLAARTNGLPSGLGGLGLAGLGGALGGLQGLAAMGLAPQAAGLAAPPSGQLPTAVFSGAPPAAPSSGPPPSQPAQDDGPVNGLLSLVNASMIHPMLQQGQQSSALRDQLAACGVPSQGVEDAVKREAEHMIENASAKKRQRSS